MKIIALIVISFFIATFSIAQQYTIDFNNSTPPSKKAATINKGTVYNFSYPGIIFKEINTKNGIYNQMFVPNTYRSGNIGEPQLVSSQKLISIPAESKVKVRVISYTTEDYSVNTYFADNKIIPYQPSYSKNENIQEKKLVVNNESYNQNVFSVGSIASIKVLGTLRDKRIAKLTINPSSYNPVTNTIRFYNNIEVEVIVENTAKINSVSSQKSKSAYFNSSYQKIESVISESSYPNNPDLTGYPVKYLIITPNNYVAGLQNFIKWKTQKGFEVVVGNLNEIGSTAASIKTWVHNQYNSSTTESPAPSFLLLVGDIQQIPASQSGIKTGRPTDLYYASVDGDMFPDMYYGRIPAQDTAQLRVMLSKTMKYEKYEFANDSFLDNITLIAGADGSYNALVAQPTIKYGTTNYFNTAHGFSNINSYLNTYTGCYANDKTAVSMINYTAHCSQTTWATPSLTAALAKTTGINGQYTLAIGNCCQSGDFSTNECMGEAWVRNPNAGAIAYLGSVPDTYWYEDFYWAVGAHNPVANQFPTVSGSSVGVYDALFGSEYQSVDAMIFVGNLAVTEAINEGYTSEITSQYYWEAYHCLGDPSIIPYLTKGLSNTISHDSAFRFGLPEFEVNALPGSTVALSNTMGLIGIAIAGLDGIASVKTDTLTLIDSVTLVVTKPKYKPYIKTLAVGEVVGTYLIVEKIKVIDAIGNSNGKMDVGEDGNLEITVKNIGNQLAENIWVTITSNDTCLKSMSQNIKILANSIPANGIVTLSSSFNYSINDFVPDQYSTKFNISLSDSVANEPREFYPSSFNTVINAPNFNVLSYSYLDDFSGNGNNYIDYGETATLKLAFVNSGHAVIETDAFLSNVSISKAIQISTTQVNFTETSLNDTVFVNFEIQIPQNTSIKTIDTLLLKIISGQYQAESKVYISIGQNLFAQLGNDKLVTVDYPFNNYFKNNSTQLLFRGTEFGTGARAITSLAFDISKFTSNASYRDLSNFKIKAAVTSVSELVSKIELVNPQSVYVNNAYLLPSVLGWEKFDLLNPIIVDDSKNIVLEISWGATDNFVDPKTDRTQVNSSNTTYKSVVWGADDYITPAPLNTVSSNRPNAQFEFDSVGILNITVSGNLPITNSYKVNNCRVVRSNDTKFTDELGRTQFYFLEYTGNYNFGFSSYGYYDTTITINKTKTYQHAQVQLRRHPELSIKVINSNSLPIENAAITIGGKTFMTNSMGEIKSFSSPQNSQTVYSINKGGYISVTDSVLINSVQKTITITLVDKFSDVIVKIQNTKNEPIANATVYVNSHMLTTDSKGEAIFNGLVMGKHQLQVYQPNFVYMSDTIQIVAEANNFTYTLKTIGKVLIQLTSNNNSIQNINVKFGDKLQTTDSRGQIEMHNIIEGTYPLRIENENYYPITNSIQVFGNTTTINVELKKKTDVRFYVHNGLVAIKNADIKFDTLSLYSDTLGVVIIKNRNIGTYYYTLHAEGYYPLEGKVDIAYTDTILNQKMIFIPDLNIEIQAPSGDASKIPLYFEKDTLYANADGIIKLINIGLGTFHYRIKQPGYYEIYDSVKVSNENVNKVVSLIKIPDLKVVISENGKALDSVNLTLNNLVEFTNVMGEIYFDNLSSGQYLYKIEKAGYFNQTGTIHIYNADTTIYIELQPKPDLQFTVLFNGEPIENAKITIETVILFTNAKGECELNNLLPKEYIFKIEKSGYFTYSDTLVIEQLDYHEVVELQKPEFIVVFTITDGFKGLENATIIFNKSEKLTNENGVAEFNNFVSGDTYHFTISKAGYFDYSDSMVITDKHLSIEIALNLIKYNVQFKISDKNGVVNGANITFDKKVKVTNTDGIALFSDVIPLSEIPFYISKHSTHFSDSGYVSVANDTLLNVELILIGVAIDENFNTVKVYPNPSKGVFYIDAEGGLIGAEFTIIDNHGKLVLKGKITETPQKITLKNTQGIYHIQLKMGDKIISNSILLE